MLAYAATDGCRMRFLREQLDDPGAADCGRCDNCGGARRCPARSPRPPLAEAGERLRRPGVTLAPRKMWPTALANLGIDLKGRIAESAEEGRAVGRLTDLGHGQALRALFRPDAEDGPVPRRAGRRRARGARRLAPGVARPADRGRPRRVRAPSPADPRPRRGAGPLPQAARSSAAGRSSTPASLPARARPTRPSGSRRWRVASTSQLDQPLDGGPVLLVDDLVATGWTLTLAARALRAAGAGAVLPLTLGVES